MHSAHFPKECLITKIKVWAFSFVGACVCISIRIHTSWCASSFPAEVFLSAWDNKELSGPKPKILKTFLSFVNEKLKQLWQELGCALQTPTNSLLTYHISSHSEKEEQTPDCGHQQSLACIWDHDLFSASNIHMQKHRRSNFYRCDHGEDFGDERHQKLT